jgi:hypothetical protein
MAMRTGVRKSKKATKEQVLVTRKKNFLLNFYEVTHDGKYNCVINEIVAVLIKMVSQRGVELIFNK